MAYEKQTWACGDTISAEKLNHMEDGIANAGGGGTSFLEVHEIYSEDRGRLDKTWQEIWDAYPYVIIIGESAGQKSIFLITNISSDGYYIQSIDPTNPSRPAEYSASSASDYPEGSTT